jgi:hypothetical protein
MVLGLPDPHPDPLVTSTDPAPSSSKNSKNNLDFYCFVTYLIYDFLSLVNDVNVPVFRIRIRICMFLGLPDPHPDPLVRGTDPRIRIRTKMSRIPYPTKNASVNVSRFIPGMHAYEVSTQRGFVRRNMGADVTVDNVEALLVLLHHVEHALRVAEEHVAATLALETQLLF